MKILHSALILFYCSVAPALAVTVTTTAGCLSGIAGVTAVGYTATGVTDPGSIITVATPIMNQGTNPGCSTNWLSEINGSTTITFSQPVDYVGFVWGTPDSYNTFSIYDGATLLGSYTGNGIGLNSYENFFATGGQNFTSVVFSNPATCCFETAGFSYQLASASSIPEPSTVFLPTIAGGAWLISRRLRRRSR